VGLCEDLAKVDEVRLRALTLGEGAVLPPFDEFQKGERHRFELDLRV
jgi:hypothetical protein